MNVTALVVLVFALVFALLEAWKGSASIRPSNFGWLALALLILVHIFFRGSEILFK
jgi:hypothetical protein